MEERIGDTLIRIGAMTEEQVRKVLSLQRAGDTRLFGEIALEMGFVDDQAIEKYLSVKKPAR